MGRCFRGGDRNGTTILFNTDQNSQHVMPTTKQAGSNTYLDKQTTVHLFFESVASWLTKSQVAMPAASRCPQ